MAREGPSRTSHPASAADNDCVAPHPGEGDAEVDWCELTRLALRFARQRRQSSLADTEDVAQDALAALWENLAAVRDPTRWLFVVVRRLAHKRRLVRRIPQFESSGDVHRQSVYHDGSRPAFSPDVFAALAKGSTCALALGAGLHASGDSRSHRVRPIGRGPISVSSIVAP